jgi:DNA-binding PadR family transcriptional regulator
MPVRRRSNPLSLAVLSCLAERAMHPYEMATTMRERGHHETIRLNYGSLYTAVRSLERQGFVIARETEREGRRPARTVYEITDDGRAEFVAWLSELLSVPEKDYPALEAGLALMPSLPPDEVTALLIERCRRIELEIARLTEILAMTETNGVPRLFLAEIEFERALREAELQFTRTLTDEIESGSIDGIDQWRAFHGPAHTQMPVYDTKER